MWDLGTYVIGKSGGVWRVEAADGDRYVLARHEGDERRSVPSDGDEIVRAVCSREQMEELIRRVPYIRTIQAPNDRFRRALYDEAMTKFDGVEWISVIKSVYIRSRDQRLAPFEREYEQRAKAYFYGEASAVLGLPTDRVESYIAETVADDAW